MKIQEKVLKWVLEDGVVKRGSRTVVEQAIYLTFTKTLAEVEKIIDEVKLFKKLGKFQTEKDVYEVKEELKQKLKEKNETRRT